VLGKFCGVAASHAVQIIMSQGVFNIGRPRPILDLHARGIYCLNTLAVRVVSFMCSRTSMDCIIIL
jgi:hypothetical protein